jgi:hypothetical protein
VRRLLGSGVVGGAKTLVGDLDCFLPLRLGVRVWLWARGEGDLSLLMVFRGEPETTLCS